MATDALPRNDGDYDTFMRSLRRVEARPNPNYAEAEAIGFVVEWMDTNGDAVREFLGEFDDVGCVKCGATNLPTIGHEPCPGVTT